MNTTKLNPVQSMTIYACGGTATNIVRPWVEAFKKTENEYVAKSTVYYLDTSTANGVDPSRDDSYVTKGTVGSGGIRNENYEVIMEETPSMLEKCRPADYCVLITSTSGGSGSVLAPAVARALMERDKVVVVLIVGDMRSGTEAKNTVKTLRSFFGIARNMNRALAGRYFENGVDGTMTEVDNLVRNYISSLAVLFSGRNHALDNRDVYNFFNYDRVSDREADFANIIITTNVSEKEPSAGVVGCIAIGSNPDNDRPKGDLEYFKHGCVPESTLTYDYLRYFIEDVTMFERLKEAELRHNEFVDNMVGRPKQRRHIELGGATATGIEV